MCFFTGLTCGEQSSGEKRNTTSLLKGQGVDVIAYADKAAERLKKRYDRLIQRNVPHNKAIVAVARELACFIWGMETENIY